VLWVSGTVDTSIKHGEFTASSVTGTYSGINFTESLASGTGNVSEPRLMSQVGSVHEVVCVWIAVLMRSER